MKESQVVTTTVKIYIERKIQSVKEFHQIGNDIPLILHGSINQIWTVALILHGSINQIWTVAPL